MIGTLRRELLDRMMIVNEYHLRQVLTGYRIRRKQVLSGLAHEYYIAVSPPTPPLRKRRSPPRITFSSPHGRADGTVNFTDPEPTCGTARGWVEIRSVFAS